MVNISVKLAMLFHDYWQELGHCQTNSERSLLHDLDEVMPRRNPNT